MYKSITVEPLTPRIGAIIGNVDLKAMSDQQFDEVRQAIGEHQVIFFRDQPLDPASLKDVGQRFGPLQIHALKGLPDHPEVRKLHADENSKHVAGEEWHTDMSCAAVPPMGSILYLHTLPTLGGDTAFASMYAAYDALSDRMKAYLEGLTATHDGRLAFGRFDPEGKFPIAVHPVIRTHPVTGERLIYVNAPFTMRIKGMSEGESQRTLAHLFLQADNPDYPVRLRWEPGDIAFWDNRGTQHSVSNDVVGHRRLERVTIIGDRPF